MATVVIPYVESRSVPAALSLAMLGDVLAACTAVGATRVVTGDDAGAELAHEAGADVYPDPGKGQNAAVAAGLAGLEPGATLIVNSDVPCAVPADLRALLAATPAGGMALVEALDGTTNALSISAADTFAPLYGRDSASRFRTHARDLGLDSVSVAIPNLADDVDTAADLGRLQLRLGPRSQACMAEIARG